MKSLIDTLFLIKSIRNPTSSFSIIQFRYWLITTGQSTYINYNISTVLTTCSRNHTLSEFFICGMHYWQLISTTPLTQSKTRFSFFNQFVDNFKFDLANSCTFHFLCPCSRSQFLPKLPGINDL